MAKVAIVTGSDSGIGQATALALADAGCDVGVTWHTDREGAEETASGVRAAGQRAEIDQVDLSDPLQGAGVVDQLAATLGGLDILVNCAGTGSSTPFLELGFDEWRHVLTVDLDGAFACSQVAARRMKDKGAGCIVNITSVHEHVPLAGAAPYCAAKGGLGLLTKVMALELAPFGITVNSVAPGEIATAMTGNEDVEPNSLERPGIPAGRPGDAREIAAVVAFLASPEASYVTGSSLVADGGLLLMAAIRNQ